MHVLHELFALYPVCSLLQLALTVWMIADYYRRQPAESYWIWIILLFQPVGAWAYFVLFKLGDFRVPSGWALFTGGPSLQELRYRAQNIPTLANHQALAQRLIERRQYDEAIPHLEAGLKTEPDHGQLLYSLALCHTRARRPEQALPLLERLLGRDPRWSHYIAWRLLIEARTHKGDSAGALTGCRELARLSPTLENNCLLAEHLLAGGLTDEAQGLLERALRDHSFTPMGIRWRNRRWASRARRLQRCG